MKPLSDALGALTARLKTMSLTQQLTLIGMFALIVGLSTWGWAAMTAPRYSVLFGNLEQQDAAEIMERLKSTKVPFRLEGTGSQILVPEEQVHELRLTLAGEGLPTGGGAGFELFDQQRFGESEFSEQVKYHRALEGELSRTIGHLHGVEGARVHLVLPARSLFATQDNAASASVALKLRRGAQLSREQTKGIVHLVAASVRGLRPEAVTIVDGSGRRLAGLEEESEGANTSLEFQRNYEHSLEAALRHILDAAVGPGKSVVRVAADVSFTREETTEERIDPAQTASRSFQVVEEREGGSVSSAGGVPGAVSTLEGSDPNLTGEKGGPGLVRRSETRNFEVSKTVRKAFEPVGRVTRLSLAVAVDGVWTGVGDKRTFAARKPEELAQIRNLVASAAGIKDARGDQLTIECVPFTEVETGPFVEDVEPGFLGLVKRHWQAAVGIGGLILVLLVTTFVLLMGRGKQASVSVALEKVLPPQTVEARLAGGTTPAQEKLLGNAMAHAALPEGGVEPRLSAGGEEDGDDPKADAERIRAMTLEIATSDPYLAASVIRGWLKESSKDDAKSAGGEAAA
jgi:flagellar M-ring protein FliF